MFFTNRAGPAEVRGQLFHRPHPLKFALDIGVHAIFPLDGGNLHTAPEVDLGEIRLANAHVTEVSVAGPGFLNWRLSAAFWHARIADVLQRLRKKLAGLKPGEWLLGDGGPGPGKPPHEGVTGSIRFTPGPEGYLRTPGTKRVRRARPAILSARLAPHVALETRASGEVVARFHSHSVGLGKLSADAADRAQDVKKIAEELAKAPPAAPAANGPLAGLGATAPTEETLP